MAKPTDNKLWAASMLVRVVRQLTLEEVQKRIKDYEKEHAIIFDEFEELFLNKKVNRRLIGVYT